MRHTDLPGLMPLKPPAGGRQRLRRALDERIDRSPPWIPAATAASAALLLALVMYSPAPHRTLSSERLIEAVRKEDSSRWIALDDGSGPARIWAALPSVTDTDDGR